jgi:hypothetical protein
MVLSIPKLIIKPMKKLIRPAVILLFLAILVPSCDLLEDCKSCTEAIQTSSGTTYGASATYCGTELVAKEAESVTINGTTTYYDCK